VATGKCMPFTDNRWTAHQGLQCQFCHHRRDGGCERRHACAAELSQCNAYERQAEAGTNGLHGAKDLYRWRHKRSEPSWSDRRKAVHCKVNCAGTVGSEGPGEQDGDKERPRVGHTAKRRSSGPAKRRLPVARVPEGVTGWSCYGWVSRCGPTRTCARRRRPHPVRHGSHLGRLADRVRTNDMRRPSPQVRA